MHVHRLYEVGAEQHGGDGADEAPAGSAFDDEHDQGAVDKELHREGDKKRHPFERMTEPRRRKEDLGSENRAHQYHAVGDAAEGAEHCREERRVAKPGAIRAADHRADHDCPAECAEEEDHPASCAHPHRQHVRKTSRPSAGLPSGNVISC